MEQLENSESAASPSSADTPESSPPISQDLSQAYSVRHDVKLLVLDWIFLKGDPTAHRNAESDLMYSGTDNAFAYTHDELGDE